MEQGYHVEMKFLPLNFIDIYNFHMNSVDVADQLQNCYRFNHWFRNSKCWWSIFLWCLGVAAMNASLMYDRIYNEEAANKKEGMPRKLNHIEFLCELIFDLMGWQLDDAELGNDDDAHVSSNTRSPSASVTSSTVASITASNSTYNLSTTKRQEAFFENAIKLNRMNSTL